MDQYLSSLKEMQVQLFRIMVIAASLANLFGIALNAVLHGNALPTQVCIACGIIILIFSIWGTLTEHKDKATVGILLTVVWIEFPFLYTVYGSVILVYFILSILGIVVFAPRKIGIPFSIATIIWDVLIVIITHLFHLNRMVIDETFMFVFSVCTYLITAIASLIVLREVLMRYEKQRKELYEKNIRLDYLATHDPLTNLYNRGYLMKEIKARIQTENAKFIAVLMDVDNFKGINDTYGHSFGDTVLVTFAQLMEKEVEGKGFAARFGGEEFMIIYDHNDEEEVRKGLHNLAVQLEEYFQKEKQISVTFSGGLELYDSQKKMDELIINADNKLYQAKKSGKNQIIS